MWFKLQRRIECFLNGVAIVIQHVSLSKINALNSIYLKQYLTLLAHNK